MAHNWVLWYAGTDANQRPGTTGRAALHGLDRLNGRVTFEKGSDLQTFPHNAFTGANTSPVACLRTYLPQPPPPPWRHRQRTRPPFP